MKKSARYTALALVTLTSALLLGACGGNKQETATSGSSSTTTSMAKSTKPKRTSSSLSSVSSSNTVSQNAGATSKTVAANANTASQATQGVQNQAPQASENNATSTNQSTVASQTQKASNAREKGVLALTKGDYSNAAGEWRDAKGNVITIDPAGTITIQKAGEDSQTYRVAAYSYTLDDGQYHAQLSGTDGASQTNIQITTGDDGLVTTVQVLPE